MTKVLNMMLHCGAQQVERQEIGLVNMPVATDTHRPIEHDVFVDMVDDHLRDRGLVMGNQAHALSANGQRYFGMAELQGLQGVGADDHTVVVGLRNAHDKAFASGLLCGSGVFVCDNLAFSGEFKMTRKHTRHIMVDLPWLIDDMIGNFQHTAEQQTIRYERYKSATLKDSVANHTVIQMLRHGVINTSRVEKVVNEYYEPTHPEHAENGRSNWTLFNAATEALKGSGVATLPERTIKLHNLIDQATDYALAA